MNSLNIQNRNKFNYEADNRAEIDNRNKNNSAVNDEGGNLNNVNNANMNNQLNNDSNSLGLTQDENMNKIIRKINYMDFQLNNLLNFGGDLIEVKKKVKEHDETLKEHKFCIDDSNYYITYI
jgi:hypothetical protein